MGHSGECIIYIYTSIIDRYIMKKREEKSGSWNDLCSVKAKKRDRTHPRASHVVVPHGDRSTTYDSGTVHILRCETDEEEKSGCWWIDLVGESKKGGQHHQGFPRGRPAR